MSADPVRSLWDALEQHGYNPHGQPHDFRSRCPGHQGENPASLHVIEGVDRRAVLYCFAQRCEPHVIVQPLGLTVADLFPDGHRRARRRHLPAARRDDLHGNARVVCSTLAALDMLDMPWQAMVATVCPYCGSPGAWLRTHSGDDPPRVDCPGGCHDGEFTGALAARLADRRGVAR